MAVYVDEVQVYGSKGEWCHMMTDGNLDELHAIAAKIGMQQRWFQNHPSHPHYDLRPSARAAAIKAGALVVSGTEMVNRCSLLLRRLREENPGIPPPHS